MRRLGDDGGRTLDSILANANAMSKDAHVILSGVAVVAVPAAAAAVVAARAVVVVAAG